MTLLSPSLQAFLAVAKRGKIHAAVQDLKLTQSALTQRIKSLEDELQVSLFTRSRQGMALTREGELLQQHCWQVLDLEHHNLIKIKGSDKDLGSIPLRLLGPSSLVRGRVIPLLAKLYRAYPKLCLTLSCEDDESQSLELLRSGNVDLVILPKHRLPKELASRVLADEHFILIYPLSWQGRSISEIVRKESIIDFSPLDTYTFDFLRQHKLLEKAQQKRHFVNDSDSLLALIEAGLGYSVISVDYLNQNQGREAAIVRCPLKPLVIKQSIAWYPRPYLNPWVEGLLAELSP